MEQIIDIAVVGAGPSGMAAAITAARCGVSVVVIEAQSRVGRKLLSTGNGRCNITNSDISSAHYRSHNQDFVADIIDRITPEEILNFLNSLGLECFEEREGRIYPRSEQATAVLDLLRAEMDRVNVRIVTDCRITKINRNKCGFELLHAGGIIKARRVIIACGSSAAPQLGGCADGLALMRHTGHKSIVFTPALVGVKVESPHLKALKGVRWRCRLSLLCGGKTVHSEMGEIQFNEDNLSGIVTMQMSSRIAHLKDRCVMSADLLPEYTKEQTVQIISELSQQLGHMPLESFLVGVLNKRISVCILKQAGITGLARSASDLSKTDINAIASAIKEWFFPVTGNCGWKTAQVASGGLVLGCFDRNLQSLTIPGLYACGEVLDCDGDCGGFNLHWAWCTGIITGRSAAGR